jgi:5S rRNA maturation endonuclease (ribonuclease M5)
MYELNQQLDPDGKLYTHLQSRHINFNLHRVWMDEAAGIASFPLYNLRGQMIGYQHYRPSGSKNVNNNPYEGKYFTRKPTSLEPTYWGVESWNLSNTLFLVEGLFDAARLTSLGYSALATFTNNPGDTFLGFVRLVQQLRPVVAICDNDAAGIKLAKYAHTHFILTTGKDVSEADETEILTQVKHYDKL